jgi:hypothetical protein
VAFFFGSKPNLFEFANKEKSKGLAPAGPMAFFDKPTPRPFSERSEEKNPVH